MLSNGTIWCWGGNGNGQLGDGTTQATLVPRQMPRSACGVPGDGNLDWGEECEDGNAVGGDGCSATGRIEKCHGVVCPASDACHEGVCDPETGLCTNLAKLDGATCDDGNACTRIDTCQSGLCVGAEPVACTAQDQCHEAGACDPATGLCSNPTKGDGTFCNDADACTQADFCIGGTCVGQAPVVCVAQDGCHEAGTCDPATGICSSPVRPDGEICDDGSTCTDADQCVAGTCAGSVEAVAIASIGAGGEHSCAVHADGGLWCWGRDNYNQLGNGAAGASLVPLRIGLEGWRTVASSDTHSCAIRSDETLWCWGNNWWGQLGTSQGDGTTPAQVPGEWTWLTTGGDWASYTCAVRGDQTLWCWGANSNGNLGNGRTDGGMVPEQIDAGPWASVEAGSWHTCGIKTDGSLWCWGNNERGQIGDGTTTIRLTPARIGDQTWTSVAPGGSPSAPASA
jgi:cysteine-rich repeat protein